MISIDITLSQIIEQFSPARDHLKQASARVVVLIVDPKMLGQFVYTLRQQRDLHLGRPCVVPVRLVVAN